MNVGELKEMLEDVDDDLEVRIAAQPSWPLRFTLRGIVTPEAFEETRHQQAWDDTGVDVPDDEEPDEDAKYLWIVQGDHPSESPYAPRIVWEA